MSSLHDLFQRLLGRSDIWFNGSLYMRRWRIIHTKWFGVRIHNICRADADREMHDHPFSFVSVILRGGYTEHRPVGAVVPALASSDLTFSWDHGPGSILYRKAEDLHRLDPVKPNTWTLVFRGPMRRSWGFMTKKGWVHWKRFVAERQGVGVAAGPFATESSI